MPDTLEWQAAVSLDFFLKDFFYDLSTCGQTLLKGGAESKIETIWDFIYTGSEIKYLIRCWVFSPLEIYVLTSKFLK